MMLLLVGLGGGLESYSTKIGARVLHPSSCVAKKFAMTKSLSEMVLWKSCSLRRGLVLYLWNNCCTLEALVFGLVSGGV